MKPATPEAYELLHKGSLALANVERNGFAVDTEYLAKAKRKVSKEIDKADRKMKEDPLWKVWKYLYGSNAKLTSRDQLMAVLIQGQLVKNVKVTAKGNIVGDRNALEKVDHPLVRQYLETEKLRKLHGTYIKGIEREVDQNGLLHCFFNLNLVSTFRSSSSDPNLQNIPIRDPIVGKVIRGAFIPRATDRQLIEIDYSGLEVRISAVYNQDPKLIEYLNGHGDMHRDAGADLFLCKPEQVSKTVRFYCKNQYVFPEFYGSYYKQCAPNLWESIDRYKFEVDGIPMKEWLKSKGIKSRGDCITDEKPKKGTFEDHVRRCEDILWNDRFKVYRDWKKSWYEKYLRRGYFRYKTGFVVDSIVNKKEASNFGVQGTAFHCLLWSLIQIDKLIRKRKLDALIVSQIHDSIVADVHKDHVDDYIQLATDVMTKKIMRHWKWINIPLLADVEVSPLGQSWYEKREV